MKRRYAGLLAMFAAGAANAGSVTLGTPLGLSLGGVALGGVLPIAGGAVLVVAATSLVIGIRIARRKRKD